MSVARVTLAVAPLLVARVVEPLHPQLERARDASRRAVYVHRGAMEIDGSPPVLIDHDFNRRVGRVASMYEGRVDGEAWLMVDAELDTPSAWLRRGTGVSMAYDVINSSWLGRTEVVGRGELAEVSVLSVLKSPRVRDARVLSIVETGSARRAVAARAADHGSLAAATERQAREPASPLVNVARDPELAELSRRIDAAGRDADVALIVQNLRRELHGPTADDLCAELAVSGRRAAIRRPGGSILGVR